MRSPLATPLTAERLFGHVCWGLAWRGGPEAVGDLLARMAGPNPPLVLGEPAPVNFVAMPVVLRDGMISPDVTGKRLSLWNLYRRAGLMPRAALLKSAADLTATGLREALDASGWPRPVQAKRQLRVRSGASRLSGTPIGKSDWLAVESWPDGDGGQMEVLIASDLEVSEIERLLVMGLQNGVGRAASVGYGQVELVSVEEIDWPEVSGANALVTLGPCVPKQSDPTGGWWRVQTRWGKLGGAFAADGTAVEKRPVMGLKAGAVLTTAVASCQLPVASCQLPVVSGQVSDASGQLSDPSSQLPVASEQQQQVASGVGLEGKAFVGRLVPGVHPQRPEVVHYGMAPVVAVRLAQ